MSVDRMPLGLEFLQRQALEEGVLLPDAKALGQSGDVATQPLDLGYESSLLAPFGLRGGSDPSIAGSLQLVTAPLERLQDDLSAVTVHLASPCLDHA